MGLFRTLYIKVFWSLFHSFPCYLVCSGVEYCVYSVYISSQISLDFWKTNEQIPDCEYVGGLVGKAEKKLLRRGSL